MPLKQYEAAVLSEVCIDTRVNCAQPHKQRQKLEKYFKESCTG